MMDLYGINTSDKVTPKDIRDAIVTCFFEAHCSDTGMVNIDDNLGKDYCEALVKKSFKKVDANFDNPTVEDINKVVQNLAEFSQEFRSKDVIEKHKKEIMEMLTRVE